MRWRTIGPTGATQRKETPAAGTDRQRGGWGLFMGSNPKISWRVLSDVSMSLPFIISLFCVCVCVHVRMLMHSLQQVG